MPVLAPAGWAARTSADRPTELAIIAAPFADGIEIVFTLAVSSGTRWLSDADLQDLGVSYRELGALAMENAVTSLVDLPYERDATEPSLFVVSTGDGHAATRLLLTSLWRDAARAVAGDLLVVAPSRDVVIFTGSETPGGEDALRRAAERAATDGPDALAGTVLRYGPEGFGPRMRRTAGILGTLASTQTSEVATGDSSPATVAPSREPPPAEPLPPHFVPFVRPRLLPVGPPAEALLGRAPDPEVRDALAVAARVQEVRFPAAPVSLSLEAVSEWSGDTFRTWIAARLAALRAAEASLNALFAPGRPADELALAAASSGFMYEDFIEAFIGAPVPQVLQNEPHLYVTYVGALVEQAAPLANTARERYLFCRNTLRNLRSAPALLAHCEQAIARIDRAFSPR